VPKAAERPNAAIGPFLSSRARLALAIIVFAIESADIRIFCDMVVIDRSQAMLLVRAI
jgi:hypothetical protein